MLFSMNFYLVALSEFSSDVFVGLSPIIMDKAELSSYFEKMKDVYYCNLFELNINTGRIEPVFDYLSGMD